MYELVEALKAGAALLKRATPNPISLTAGCDLFIRYVSTARQDDLVNLGSLPCIESIVLMDTYPDVRCPQAGADTRG